MTAQTILVVEDNSITQKLARVVLEGEGYRVTCAADGRTALERMAQERPDLVLQDLVLPDMDGLELVRKLRAVDGSADIPILACSGFLSKMEQARLHNLGFTAYLFKPIEPSDLVKAVRRHLPVPALGGEKPGRGRHILVAGHDGTQLRLWQSQLELAGFAVSTAQDGMDALLKALQDRPDAIVSDVLTPALDGFRLSLAVRSHQHLGGVPLLLVTSSDTEDADRRLAERVGASRLIQTTAGDSDLVSHLLHTLDAPPPHVAPPGGALAEEYSQRIIRQLERQTSDNLGLSQRLAAREAELAILAGLAGYLKSGVSPEKMLGTLLYCCLDALGATCGAAYLLSENGSLELRDQIGFNDCDLAQSRSRPDTDAEPPAPTHSGAQIAARLAPLSQGIRRIIDRGEPGTFQEGATSWIVIPLGIPGACLGAFVIKAPDTDCGEEWASFAKAMGGQIGHAIMVARGHREVAEGRERLGLILDTLAEALLVTDHAGRVIVANPAAEEILGVPRKTLLGSVLNGDGRRFLDARGVPLADDELPFIRVLATGESVLGVELCFERADARRLVLSVNANPFRERQSPAHGAVVLISDITARKEGEVARSRLEDQLREAQKLEALGTLTAGIAHDFNNILAAIAGNASLALPESSAGSAAETSLAEILKAAIRGRELVRRILTYSRPEEGIRKPINLQSLAEEALKLLRSSLPHKIQIRSKFAPDLPRILADASQIHQVLLNLGTNAAHAMDELGGLLEVRVEAVALGPGTEAPPDLRPGRYVRLCFRDTGCGMDQNTRERMFEPFFTTKPAGLGSGLGLSVVHGIVKSHGGGVVVHTQPGKGTDFHLYFPACGQAAEEAPEPPTKVAAGRGRRILFVDDETALVFLAERALKQLGYEVTGCTDPFQALEIFRKDPDEFDAVVTDLSMPGLSGTDLISELRKVRPGLRVLVTSGYVRPQDNEMVRRVGVQELILKPSTIQELATVLHKVLSIDQ